MYKCIQEIPELEVIGRPYAIGLSVRSKKFNIFCLESILKEKSWEIKCCQYPNCVSINITEANLPNIDKLCLDIKESVKIVSLINF